MSFSNTRYGKLLLISLVGVLIWFVPHPETVEPQAWHLFAVFVATVLGLILAPYPLGAIALTGITVAVAFKLLTIKDALSGFSSSSIWIIACAFFISRSFIKTGFGRRIGYLFIDKLGHNALGLAYGLVFTDLIFAPAMPSTTARCGGILTPLFRSISEAYESTPEKGTERRIGAYLIQCIFQCNAITCAMFATSMAGNPIAVNFASEMGIKITWMDWAVAAVVPGLILLLVIPLLLYRFYPPELKRTPEMRKVAAQKLREMGKMSRDEWTVLLVFIGLVFLWASGAALNIDATWVAFAGVVVLLLTDTLSWDDVLSEKEAWHTVVWFAVLITLAGQLNRLGFISWFGTAIGDYVDGMSWYAVTGILLLVYYYSHYMMASGIAHISAMYSIFVSVAISAGAPPLLAALIFGMFGNLYMATTHYSGGPAPILFGCGYIPVAKWWKIGFLMSPVVILLWVLLCCVWWNICGLL
ncbi:MAG: anion permease [Tannerella sp.]|jgi:DASS family divalent anion:Na+ symporter|nr:anion permease [Tannerella sp.]